MRKSLQRTGTLIKPYTAQNLPGRPHIDGVVMLCPYAAALQVGGRSEHGKNSETCKCCMPISKLHSRLASCTKYNATIYVRMKRQHRTTWLPYAGLQCGGLGQLQQCPSGTLSTIFDKIVLPKIGSIPDDCETHPCSSDVVHPELAASKEALLPIPTFCRASQAL